LFFIRPEDLKNALLTYDYLALGRRRNDNAIVAMMAVGSEIDVIDQQQYKLLTVSCAASL